MKLKNKVVIVTGSSSGIGKALAESFALHGAFVVLSGRNIGKLNEVANELKDKTKEDRVVIIPADISKEDDCNHLIDETIKRFGQIDVLIANAGISMRASFQDVDLKVLHEVMNTNF